jgi:Flp pilus assembly protein CpaB
MAVAATSDAALVHAPKRGPRSRLSTGHVVMVVAGLGGMVLTLAALRADTGGAGVAVASRDIRPGEVIAARDFHVEHIRADHTLLSTIVGQRAAASLRGQIAVTSIADHALIPRGAVRPRAARAGLRAMSIPLDPSVAVSGRLAAGDRVDVLAADQKGAAIIVADAEVLGVDARERGGIGESSSPFTVTIAVDAPQSMLVAAAIADGHISIARTTGARPSTASPTTATTVGPASTTPTPVPATTSTRSFVTPGAAR